VKLTGLLWLLVGVALVTAFGVAVGNEPAAAAVPSVIEVARVAGCTTVDRTSAGTGMRERVTCRAAGFDVTAVTFDDNAQRDVWVDEARLEVVVHGMTGVPDGVVAGDRWAARTADPAAYDRLVTVARGWRV
jgi:hypothetical protein